MNYNLRGVINLANAVIEQAIKDVVEKKKNGKPKNKQDFITAKYFLENNCGFYGEFFGLDEETIAQAIEKYIAKKKHLRELYGRKEKIVRKPRVYKGVKCVETGEVFKTIREAERKMKIHNVSLAVNGKQRHAGGFTWVWAVDD